MGLTYIQIVYPCTLPWLSLQSWVSNTLWLLFKMFSCIEGALQLSDVCRPAAKYIRISLSGVFLGDAQHHALASASSCFFYLLVAGSVLWKGHLIAIESLCRKCPVKNPEHPVNLSRVCCTVAQVWIGSCTIRKDKSRVERRYLVRRKSKKALYLNNRFMQSGTTSAPG